MSRQPDEDSVPDNTPVLTSEERKAQWERRLLEEVEGWRKAAGQLGITNPVGLWNAIESIKLTAKMKFVDMLVIAVRAQENSLAIDENAWDLIFKDASRAWEVRERYIKGETE